jgi:endonuclease/exonuclease/phosphatase (EEP) superfamily protein YafD
MISIVFWNVNKKDLRSLLCSIACDVDADVVILLESGISSDDNLKQLRSSVSRSFFMPQATRGRFQLFARTKALDLSEAYGSDRLSLRRLTYSDSSLLLGIVHIVDKLNWSAPQQLTEVQLLAASVREQEAQLRTDRTLLLGDFNMNPYDDAMTIAAGLNAMMSVGCVSRQSRIQQGRSYPFFYNPMWSLFGDRTPGPSGTYYHRNSSQGVFGWNMLDQVLIRPSALPYFDEVRILSSAGGTPLHTSSMRPSANVASDHFPLLLRLK